MSDADLSPTASMLVISLETLRMALRAIRRNTMRSILTTLGIVIGVASVIMMVTLGKSATVRVTSDISNLGTNMLFVVPGADRRGPSGNASPRMFDLEDARALKREVSEISRLAPASARSALTVYGNANYNTVVHGSTADFFPVRNRPLGLGRAFTDAEVQGGAAVCVLGETVRRELFGGQSPLGSSIRVGAIPCAVIGVLEAKGQSTFGQDQDDFLVMPLTAFQQRIAGNNDIGVLYATVSEESAISRAKWKIEALMRERRHVREGEVDDFSVRDTREIVETVGKVTGVMTVLLGAVAAVSLLVGGIGIMNIMLVSVTERTREIGIRLAIGALGHEVLMQFLVESILLCVLGGAIGVLFGLGGSYAAARALEFPFIVDPSIVGIAFAFSASIGVVFGYLPARRAARLNPIEALRHE